VTGALVSATADGGHVHLVLGGEVDLANARDVEAQLLDAISNQADRVSLDLTDVSYLDSAGIRILFQLVDRLRTLQIEALLIAPPHSPARRVLELSGLATLVPLDPPVA
jgi:anti-anti-sigma factor